MANIGEGEKVRTLEQACDGLGMQAARFYDDLLGILTGVNSEETSASTAKPQHTTPEDRLSAAIENIDSIAEGLAKAHEDTALRLRRLVGLLV